MSEELIPPLPPLLKGGLGGLGCEVSNEVRSDEFSDQASSGGDGGDRSDGF